MNLALEDFNTALVVDYKYVNIYISRGLLRERMGNYDEAEKDYNKCVELDPVNEIAINNRFL